MQFGERGDITLGAVVLLVAAGLLAWVHSLNTAPETDNGLGLYASFQRSDGLEVGADVRLAGIPVGRVAHMKLGSAFKSEVTLSMQQGIRIPEDSAAVIHTSGLFGGKYIEIEPGGALDHLQNGDTIAFTQDSLVVEDLLARLTAIAKSRNARCIEQIADTPSCSASDSKDDQKPAAPSLLLPLTQGNPE